jgi:hypothetical protein
VACKAYDEETALEADTANEADNAYEAEVANDELTALEADTANEADNAYEAEVANEALATVPEPVNEPENEPVNEKAVTEPDTFVEPETISPFLTTNSFAISSTVHYPGLYSDTYYKRPKRALVAL